MEEDQSEKSDTCIFCKIAQGELGCPVAETLRHVVFLDIAPMAKGHLLVVPKYHAKELHLLPDQYLREALVLIKEVKNRIGTIEKYNVLQNNGNHQSVAHVHYHLIPYYDENREGLSVNWTVVDVPKEEMDLLQRSYKELLKDLNTKE